MEKAKDQPKFVSSGCTVFNLMLSDRGRTGGWQIGKVHNLVGDSSSGKSFLALSMLEEMCQDAEFAQYLPIYDDVEQASEFNLEKLFHKLSEAIAAPLYDGENPVFSDTVEEFHFHVLDALRSTHPFVYVLDSLDMLDAKDDQKKVDEQYEAHKKGKKTAGTYGMAKPKYLSWMLRNLKAKIRHTESMLLIISQTRDNINPLSFEKKTRSGGNALRFACAEEVWLAQAGKITRKGRVIGVHVKAKAKKNKVTGKLRECEFDIYYDYGIDDIGACIDFLIKEGHWKTQKNSIIAEEFDLKGLKDTIIKGIEEGGLEDDLRDLTEKVWLEIEEACKLNRKKKYSGD